MKVSLSWLDNYVDVKEFFDKPEELDKLLTAAGLEVDGIENQAKNFSHVVVGRVNKLEKHPDADRLTYCQVQVGPDDIRPIICGAKNHKEGDFVVAALPGACLPGDFKIKKSKIRGVESEGMLCSNAELGLDGDSEGILILSEGAEVGQPFAAAFGLDDIIFELSVTANRADCLSHIGLAREVACLLGRELKYPESKFEPSSISMVNEGYDIRIENENKCPRYSGRIVKGVKVAESPSWLKRRLESVGLNSINNVVDITNFVMHEYGQPMHAFDLAEIKSKSVVIKVAEEGTDFTSLDGTEFKLKSDDLGIYDDDRLVALAGVVGGKNSGVSDQTTDLFLEVAHFTTSTVRKTARRLGIETDACYRFSRGTDPSIVEEAMNRACYLVQSICSGSVSSDVIDRYPAPIERQKISISAQYVEDRLGYPVVLSDLEDWMKRLGCLVERGDNDELICESPSWRWDIEIKEDLVEEFGRLNGYDKIPERLPMLNYEPSAHDRTYLEDRFVNEHFARQGLYQAVNHHFISHGAISEVFGDNLSVLSDTGLEFFSDFAEVSNPLSDEYKVMRPSLLPGLFKNLVSNYRSGISQGQIFETGRVFSTGEDSYKETRRLGLIMWGDGQNLWTSSKGAPLVLHLKSFVENFLSSLKANGYQWKKWAPDLAIAHSGRSASLFFRGRPVGFIAEMHPKLQAEFKIRTQVALAEFDLVALMKSFPQKPKLKVLSKYPAVERDFSFMVPKSMAAQQVCDLIMRSEKKLIQQVSIVDQYEGDGVPEGQHSLTFRVLMQHMDKTLSDDEVTQAHKLILEKVQPKLV